nr:hypothetical protein GCM10020185_88280 [Pseudomonas brassicacearum subsp. brassicacearum]
MFFLSGELPFNEDGSFPAGIEAQTRLTLMRIAQTLEAESLSLDDVVSVTVYLTERSNFAEFNRIYASFFSRPICLFALPSVPASWWMRWLKSVSSRSSVLELEAA